MRFIPILSLTLLTFGCARPIPWNELQFETIEGNSITLSTPSNGSAHLYFFLSPECPLCQSYSKNIFQYDSLYANSELKVFGVFPGKEFSKEEIESYRSDYRLNSITFLLDLDYLLTRYVEAVITPEVFLIDHNGLVQYRGAIDNWAVSVRKHRQKITENYLDDAIEAVLNNEVPIVKHTEAIGCFIE